MVDASSGITKSMLVSHAALATPLLVAAFVQPGGALAMTAALVVGGVAAATLVRKAVFTAASSLTPPPVPEPSVAAADTTPVESPHVIDRSRAMDALAASFERTVKAVVHEVVQASGEIGDVATRTAERSHASGNTSLSVGEAAMASTQRVATVAAATQQLTSSVNEIAQQVAQATTVAGDAVTKLRDTDESVRGLSEAAQEIGNVVRLINDIAAQTNLLALNATIEAARAGEAGKGFAVVAGEVKTLANQTAQATEQIARQVAAVQRSTAEAVDGLDSIGSTIRRVDEISSAIASAVQQQGAATEEIARHIEEVSEESLRVCDGVADVTQSSATACSGAIRVIWGVDSLSERLDYLSAETNAFLAKIRSADMAVDMVGRVVAAMNADGRETVLEAITDPAGPYRTESIYVFAQAYEGLVLAHGGNPQLVGRELLDLKDADGQPFIRTMARTAREQGSGWVDYKWANPQTGRIEPKTTFILGLDDMFLGAGIYTT